MSNNRGTTSRCSTATSCYSTRPYSRLMDGIKTELPSFVPNSPWCYEPFIYRVSYGTQGVEQPIVNEVCKERGWWEYGSDQKKFTGVSSLGWNLWWRCTTNNQAPLRTLYSWQYCNQIPRGIGFCNKEYLRHFVCLLKRIFGAISDFAPTTFILPGEWNLLREENIARLKVGESEDEKKIEKIQNLVLRSECTMDDALPPCTPDCGDVQANNPYTTLWITKPVGKSQGKGILVTDDIDNLKHIEQTTVIQEYIARPYLIGGYKFDLRLYVCITSTNPLTMYVYREGLTRFATQKYGLDDLSNNYTHLTNASLNKHSDDYNKDKEHVGLGCKWTLGKLRRYFAKMGVEDFYLWQRIWSIILITAVGECNRMATIPFTKNCFAFLGYDILIDEGLRPYLLEVNLAPGLNADTDVDRSVKKPMLHGLFTLMGLPKSPKYRPRTADVHEEDYPKPPPSSTNHTVIPLSYYRPGTANKALKMIAKENMHKFLPGSKLRTRLLDMTEIYTQDFTSHLRKLKDKNKKELAKKKKKGTGTSNAASTSTATATANDKGNADSFNKVPREWHNPAGKCGGWYRVFPFDAVSHSESRNKIADMDLKVIISRLYQYLNDVRQLVNEYPGERDEVYVAELKGLNKLTTEIWHPPSPSKDYERGSKARVSRWTIGDCDDGAETETDRHSQNFLP